MRTLRTSGIAAAAALCAATAVAGQHGHAAPVMMHAPVTHPSATPPTTAPHAAARATPTHGTTTHATTSHAATTTHTPTAAHASRTTTAGGTTHKATVATAGSTTTTATSTSPIAAKIESHPHLASKVSAMLPKGMTLQRAASGFRNQGQFIAALHVSRNLGIPFADLKRQMVARHLSLGQAIQKLRPDTDAATTARTGEHEADDDLARTGTRTTTSGTTSTPHGGHR